MATPITPQSGRASSNALAKPRPGFSSAWFLRAVRVWTVMEAVASDMTLSPTKGSLLRTSCGGNG